MDLKSGFDSPWAEAAQLGGAAASAATRRPNHHSDTRLMLEPVPCDECWHAVRCNVERLACQAFDTFVAGRRPGRWRVIARDPTRQRYAELFGEDELFTEPA